MPVNCGMPYETAQCSVYTDTGSWVNDMKFVCCGKQTTDASGARWIEVDPSANPPMCVGDTISSSGLAESYDLFYD